MLRHAFTTFGVTFLVLTALSTVSAAPAIAAAPIAYSVASSAQAVITVPQGTTVASLSVPMRPEIDPSITVSGCTVGEAISHLNVTLLVPIAEDVSSEIPIATIPPQPVPESGVVDYPLRPISGWLVTQAPAPGAQIVITARTCC